MGSRPAEICPGIALIEIATFTNRVAIGALKHPYCSALDARTALKSSLGLKADLCV